MKRLFLLILAFAMVAPAASHSVTLTWNAATPSMPACPTAPTLGYNVFRGTAAGAESTTPLNATPIAALTYTDTTVAVGNSYFYTVQTVETCGSLTLASKNSNEVSAIYPNAPGSPTITIAIYQ